MYNMLFLVIVNVVVCLFFVFFGYAHVHVTSGGVFLAEPHGYENLVIYPSEKICYDVSVRPNADRTDSGGGGGESGVSPSGEEYEMAEVKCLHFKHPARFGGKSHGRPDVKRKKKQVFLSTKF